jgi:hypothetical protein
VAPNSAAPGAPEGEKHGKRRHSEGQKQDSEQKKQDDGQKQ